MRFPVPYLPTLTSRSGSFRNLPFGAQTLCLVLALGTGGCTQTPAVSAPASPDAPVSPAPVPDAPKNIAPTGASPAGSAPLADDLPPGIKPEDVARYVVERSRKRREAQEQPARLASFVPMMELAKANGAYRAMILAAKRHAVDFPRDAMAPFYLGTALFYQGDFQGAQLAWKNARRLNSQLQTRLAPLEARGQRISRRFPGGQLGAVAMVASDMTAQSTRIWNEGKALILAKNYDAIERRARQLQTQGVLLDGLSPLKYFRDGVIFQEDFAPGEPAGSGWQHGLDRLVAWQSARPDSALAMAAQIEYQTSWAWDIRSGDTADQVGPEQWKQMNEHLSRAGVLVAALPTTALQSPLVCRAVLRWGHLAGLPAPQMRALWADFDRRFPDSLDLALLWGQHLLPQWGGQPGEWERFATSWANRREGEAGDIRYAQFMLGMRGFFEPGHLWSKNQVQWPRARRGFEAMVKAHPQSVSLATGLMLMAQEAGDLPTAQQALLHHVKNRASASRYKSPREFAEMRLKILDPQGQ